MTTSSFLTLKDLNSTIILNDSIKFKESIINSSKQLISSLTNSFNNSTTTTTTTTTTLWKKGDTFNESKSLTTFTFRSKNPPGSGDTENFKWYARISKHKNNNNNNLNLNSNDEVEMKEDLFQSFKENLFFNHSKNESIYIKDCKEATLIESYGEAFEVWRTSYSLKFPITNRDFIILLHTIDTTPELTSSTENLNPLLRSFLVISIPFIHSQAPFRKGYVRGKYVSVEEVSEIMEGEEKIVLWKMATASNAGGNVPKKLTEMSMPSKISEDVPAFIKYLEKIKK